MVKNRFLLPVVNTELLFPSNPTLEATSCMRMFLSEVRPYVWHTCYLNSSMYTAVHVKYHESTEAATQTTDSSVVPLKEMFDRFGGRDGRAKTCMLCFFRPRRASFSHNSTHSHLGAAKCNCCLLLATGLLH